MTFEEGLLQRTHVPGAATSHGKLPLLAHAEQIITRSRTGDGSRAQHAQLLREACQFPISSRICAATAA